MKLKNTIMRHSLDGFNTRMEMKEQSLNLIGQQKFSNLNNKEENDSKKMVTASENCGPAI